MTEDSAKALLLKINPPVPQMGMHGESWQFPRTLKEEVREFGWDGLPTVQNLLRLCREHE